MSVGLAYISSYYRPKRIYSCKVLRLTRLRRQRRQCTRQTSATTTDYIRQSLMTRQVANRVEKVAGDQDDVENFTQSFTRPYV